MDCPSWLDPIAPSVWGCKNALRIQTHLTGLVLLFDAFCGLRTRLSNPKKPFIAALSAQLPTALILQMQVMPGEKTLIFFARELTTTVRMQNHRLSIGRCHNAINTAFRTNSRVQQFRYLSSDALPGSNCSAFLRAGAFREYEALPLLHRSAHGSYEFGKAIVCFRD